MLIGKLTESSRLVLKQGPHPTQTNTLVMVLAGALSILSSNSRKYLFGYQVKVIVYKGEVKREKCEKTSNI